MTARRMVWSAVAAALAVGSAAVDLWVDGDVGDRSRSFLVYIVGIAVANLVLLTVWQAVPRLAVRIVCGILAMLINAVSELYVWLVGLAYAIVLTLDSTGNHHPSHRPMALLAVAGLVRLVVIAMASASFAFASTRRGASTPPARPAG